MIRTVRPERFDFWVAVEFGAAQADVISGRNTRLWRTDVKPEVEITTCGSMALHVAGDGVVWAELEMYAYPAGGPIFDGDPIIGTDHQVVTHVFNVHVSKILSTTSYNRGYTEGYAKMHGKPLTAASKMRGRKMVEA